MYTKLTDYIPNKIYIYIYIRSARRRQRRRRADSNVYNHLHEIKLYIKHMQTGHVSRILKPKTLSNRLVQTFHSRVHVWSFRFFFFTLFFPQFVLACFQSYLWVVQQQKNKGKYCVIRYSRCGVVLSMVQANNSMNHWKNWVKVIVRFVFNCEFIRLVFCFCKVNHGVQPK